MLHTRCTRLCTRLCTTRTLHIQHRGPSRRGFGLARCRQSYPHAHAPISSRSFSNPYLFPYFLTPILSCLRPRPDAPYQTYLNRAGGRARVNPDPDWTLVTRVDRDPNAPWATSWDDFPPEILEAVASLQGGGGGFTPAGPKGGVFSRNNSTNTFPLRCCSSHAWGCIKKVKIVEEYLGSAIAVYDAVGWPHSHATEGAVCQLKRGLPPQVKSDILEVLKHDPRIKLGALRNYLVERKGVDPAHAKKIGTFLHNNRAVSSANELGVSSFGTVVTTTRPYDIHTVLSALGGDEDSPFCIGQTIDPDTGRLFILFSTLKMLMTAFVEQEMGYSNGIIMQDYTFKIFKEKLVMAVYSTVDILQNGKPIAFGPSTNEDATTSKQGALWIKSTLDGILMDIKNNSLPASWNATVKSTMYVEYSYWVSTAVSPTYHPGTGISDAADAIRNGICQALGVPEAEEEEEEEQYGIDPTTWKTCWAHIWRYIQKNKHKLKDSSDANVDLLYSDACYIHEANQPKLKKHLITKFVTKWRNKSEDVMVDYLEGDALKRNFSRCDGRPGNPTDTNTLERMNQHLKSEQFFNTVEGAGTVITRIATVATRLSRDLKPCAIAPEPTKKDWKKAQKMIEKGWVNLGFKHGDSYVFPSEQLIEDHIPKEQTLEQKKATIKTWAKEYSHMHKNPETYHKLVGGPTGMWDFDVLADMMFSFWILTPITDAHRQHQTLKDNGICFTCNCPRFNHYHYCKHSLAIGIHFGLTKVPLCFNANPVGKRKAPAGASLTKRSRALCVDN